jgi:hypothetical protein
MGFRVPFSTPLLLLLWLLFGFSLWFYLCLQVMLLFGELTWWELGHATRCSSRTAAVPFWSLGVFQVLSFFTVRFKPQVSKWSFWSELQTDSKRSLAAPFQSTVTLTARFVQFLGVRLLKWEHNKQNHTMKVGASDTRFILCYANSTWVHFEWKAMHSSLLRSSIQLQAHWLKQPVLGDEPVVLDPKSKSSNQVDSVVGLWLVKAA